MPRAEWVPLSLGARLSAPAMPPVPTPPSWARTVLPGKTVRTVGSDPLVGCEIKLAGHSQNIKKQTRRQGESNNGIERERKRAGRRAHAETRLTAHTGRRVMRSWPRQAQPVWV